MGKGNRNKLQRANGTSEIDQLLTTSEKTKRQNDTRKGKIISAVCIVLVAVILLILVCTALSYAGVFVRMTNILKMEEGHYQINKAMMNFFFNEQIMTWYSQYGSYASYMGLDFSKDLKSQTYSKDTTWYAYFLDQTKSQVQLYMAYANEAYNMGLELDDDDKAEISATIENLENNMDAYGLSYSNFYGEGVGKGTVKDCYEVIYMANKYSEVMTEKYKEQLKNDDSDVKLYPEDNKESFYTADVLKYQIKVESKGLTDKEYENKIADAKARAEKIAAAKTSEEFFELVKADLAFIANEDATEEEGPKPETSTEKATESSSEDQTEVSIEDYKENIEYTTDGGDVEDWLFGIEDSTSTETSEPAAKGDTFIDEATETYTEKTTEKATEKSTEASSETSTTNKEYKRYTVTAYCVDESMHLDHNLTRDLGYVVSTDKATVEKILERFKAGSMTAEALDNLGKEALEALPSDSKIQIGHSAPTKVAPGYFEKTDSTFKAIDEWLAEDGRDPGDVSDVFELKPTSSSGTTYYAVCYYAADNDEVWYVDATNGVINKRFEEWYQGTDGKGGVLASNPVTYNEREANDLYQTTVPYLLSLLSSATTTS